MNSNPEGSNGAAELIAGIWARRKWLAISAFLLVCTPGLALLWSLPKIYEASAVLVPSSAAEADADPNVMNGSNAALDLVTEEVFSRKNLAKLIKEFDVVPDQGANGVSDAALARFRRGIDVSTKRGSGPGNDSTYALTVSYRGWRPDKVAAVTNGIAYSYQQVAATLRSRQAAAAAEALKSRLALIQGRLSGQQGRLDSFLKRHLGELPEQQQVNLTALQRYDTMLQNNQDEQLAIVRKRMDLVDSANQPDASQLPQLEQKLAALRLRYTDQYPDVVQLKAEIANLKNGQSDQSANSGDGAPTPSDQKQLNTLDSELAALKSEEKRLRKQVAMYQGRVESVPVTGQELNALTRSYGQTSDIYASLLKSYEKARIEEATARDGVQEFTVLETAIVPKIPVGPARLRFTAVILFLGMGLSFLMCLAAEKRDTTFHGLDELRSFTSVPVLAAVPYIRTRQETRNRILRRLLSGVMVVLFAAILGAGGYRLGFGNQLIAQTISHKLK